MTVLHSGTANLTINKVCHTRVLEDIATTFVRLAGPVQLTRSLYRPAGKRSPAGVDAVALRAGAVGDVSLRATACELAFYVQQLTSREPETDGRRMGWLPYGHSSSEHVAHAVCEMCVPQYEPTEQVLLEDFEVPADSQWQKRTGEHPIPMRTLALRGRWYVAMAESHRRAPYSHAHPRIERPMERRNGHRLQTATRAGATGRGMMASRANALLRKASTPVVCLLTLRHDGARRRRRRLASSFESSTSKEPTMTGNRGSSPHAKQMSLRLMCEEPLPLSKSTKKQLVLSLATVLLAAAERSALDQRGDHEHGQDGSEDQG